MTRIYGKRMNRERGERDGWRGAVPCSLTTIPRTFVLPPTFAT
jgi:hypothetical protein